MGVIISSPSQLSPLSLVSITLGFIGFVFTVGTFLKIVWTNLETMVEAPHEIHEYLTTLRQELLEEKNNLKILKKQCRKRVRWRERHPGKGDTGMGSTRTLELDEVSIKTMTDSVKGLVRQFKGLERPFLVDGEEGIAGEKKHTRRRRNSSSSPYYEHSAYAGSPPYPEKSGRVRGRSATRNAHELDDDEAYWAQRVEYANLTIFKRMKWIRAKPQAQELFDTLSKVQIRRIAQQVAGMALLMHEHGSAVFDMEQAIGRIDDRVSRVVGVRRVD